MFHRNGGGRKRVKYRAADSVALKFVAINDACIEASVGLWVNTSLQNLVDHAESNDRGK